MSDLHHFNVMIEIESIKEYQIISVMSLFFGHRTNFVDVCVSNSLVVVRKQVLLAVIKGAKGSSRVSAYVMQDALLGFYSKYKLFPAGIYSEIPAVQSWALKHGLAIKKMVTSFIGSNLFGIR